MPATDQTVLLQPISSCDIPAADQWSVLLVPTSSTVTLPSSTIGATDHSELAVQTTTGAPSSADFPASHHNYNMHPIRLKSGKQQVHVLDVSEYPTCKQAERRRIDCPQNLHARCGRPHNHMCQIFRQSVQGFRHWEQWRCKGSWSPGSKIIFGAPKEF